MICWEEMEDEEGQQKKAILSLPLSIIAGLAQVGQNGEGWSIWQEEWSGQGREREYVQNKRFQDNCDPQIPLTQPLV